MPKPQIGPDRAERLSVEQMLNTLADGKDLVQVGWSDLEWEVIVGADEGVRRYSDCTLWTAVALAFDDYEGNGGASR